MYQKTHSSRGSRAPGKFSGGRPSFSRGGSSSRFPARRPSSNRGGGGRGERIDFSRFINKAIITEEVEHFIPEHSFKDFKIEDVIKRGVIAKGYLSPTPIQDRAIPHILMGQDIVGIANTGTGKTAAFLIPLLNKVWKNPKEKVIIVAPTRELAIQIEQELRGFSHGTGIYSVCVVGGASIGKQISDLSRKHNFVIGTPGRLKDLIERKKINLADFHSIVLDEADRMLDMGFIADMRYLVERMPLDRQTLFFSATLSKSIEALIKDFLREPVRISVKTQDTSKNVDQDVVRIVRGQDKMDVLHGLLTQKEFSKVLVFGRTKHGVEKIAKDLNIKGIRSESIHGNKNHSQRQRALKIFKENGLQVLVATDVAARGLDIGGVTHVINYDVPATYDDYVHRIGRTGRAGKLGKALTFIG